MECPSAEDLLNPKVWEQGEICVRGRHVMMGYYAPKDLNLDVKDKVKKWNDDTIDEDGWLHTGDRGVRKNGLFRVLGRCDDFQPKDKNDSIPRFVRPTEKEISEAYARRMAGLDKKFNADEEKRKLSRKKTVSENIHVPHQKGDKKVIVGSEVEESAMFKDIIQTTENERKNVYGQAHAKIYTKYAELEVVKKEKKEAPSIKQEEKLKQQNIAEKMGRHYVPLSESGTFTGRSAEKNQEQFPQETQPYEFKPANEVVEESVKSNLIKDKKGGPTVIGDDLKFSQDSTMGGAFSKYKRTVKHKKIQKYTKTKSKLSKKRPT